MVRWMAVCTVSRVSALPTSSSTVWRRVSCWIALSICCRRVSCSIAFQPSFVYALYCSPSCSWKSLEQVGVELEERGHLVLDLHPVAGRRGDRVGPLHGALAGVLRDDVVLLVRGVQVQLVEEPVEEQVRAGLHDLLEARAFDRSAAVADPVAVPRRLLQARQHARCEQEPDDHQRDDRQPPEAAAALPAAALLRWPRAPPAAIVGAAPKASPSSLGAAFGRCSSAMSHSLPCLVQALARHSSSMPSRASIRQ